MNTTINNVNVYPTHTDDNGLTKSNVIYEINYTNSLSDDSGNTVSFSGSRALSTNDLSNLTEFSLLTKEQVKSWLVKEWGGVQEHHYLSMVERLKKMLNEQSNPTSINMTLQG